MKAVIVAAGKGSRLLPLTLRTPKCLVRVDGRAILDHQLEAAHAAGITEAIVVGGYRIDQVAEHLATRAAPVPTTLLFNPFWSIASSIGSVWTAREHLHAAFMLMNGDTLYDSSIVKAAVGGAVTGLTLVVDAFPEVHHDHMRVVVRDGMVIDVGKGLDPAVASHCSLGLVLSSGGGAYAAALRDVIAEPGGTNSYHHAILARLAPRGVNALVVDPAARWQEVDAPSDIELWEGGLAPDEGHR